MKNTRIENLLGLTQKARMLQAGTELAEKALLHGKGKLLLLASDAAEEVRQNFLRLCKSREVPVVIFSDKITLGACIGKAPRTALLILDRGFADAIIKEVRQVNENGLENVEVVEWPK